MPNTRDDLAELDRYLDKARRQYRELRHAGPAPRPAAQPESARRWSRWWAALLVPAAAVLLLAVVPDGKQVPAPRPSLSSAIAERPLSLSASVNQVDHVAFAPPERPHSLRFTPPPRPRSPTPPVLLRDSAAAYHEPADLS